MSNYSNAESESDEEGEADWEMSIQEEEVLSQQINTSQTIQQIEMKVPPEGNASPSSSHSDD